MSGRQAGRAACAGALRRCSWASLAAVVTTVMCALVGQDAHATEADTKAADAAAPTSSPAPARAEVAPSAGSTPASSPAAIGSPPDPTLRVAHVNVPGAGRFGGDADMLVQAFVPDGPGPFPVLLFAHGRSADGPTRARMKQPIPLGHVRYWQRKGFAVVAPIRPGYGDSGGPDREMSGARYDEQGRCTSVADHANTVNNARQAMRAALDWVRLQPWARAEHILLEGQSVGGITTVALCATQPPGVRGCINFVGGSGGSPSSGGHVCNPDTVRELMRDWGRLSRVPSIWFYAPNDQYWGPDSPRQWHEAFAQGGSASQFVGTDPLPDADGHLLLYRGGRMWSQPLDEWLQANQLLPAKAALRGP
jgi:dienelactone hydrolase